MSVGVSTMPETAVSNTGPIIHLLEINQIQLLNSFEQVFIPKKVLDEAGNIHLPIKNIKVIIPNENEVYETKKELSNFKLHEGELHSLYFACKLKHLFLTDDLEAREAATFLNVKVHGTLGVIVLAYKKQLIDKEQAKKAIQQLYWHSSLFLTPFIVKEALRLLE